MAKIETVDGRTVDVRAGDLVGREVIAKRELRHRWSVIPKGARCTITSWWRRSFSLNYGPCEKCGHTISVSKVPRDRTLLVDPRRLE